MISTIYLAGFICSIVLDVGAYFAAKKGYRLVTYPKHHLEVSVPALCLLIVLWALMWPIVFCVFCVRQFKTYFPRGLFMKKMKR